MKVFVIIPAYNEELNIKKVVSNLIDQYPHIKSQNPASSDPEYFSGIVLYIALHYKSEQSQILCSFFLLVRFFVLFIFI